MDAAYLQNSVGSSLSKGLAEVACVRPADPIKYLAQWLLKHEANMKECELVPLEATSASSTCMLDVGGVKRGSPSGVPTTSHLSEGAVAVEGTVGASDDERAKETKTLSNSSTEQIEALGQEASTAHTEGSKDTQVGGESLGERTETTAEERGGEDDQSTKEGEEDVKEKEMKEEEEAKGEEVKEEEAKGQEVKEEEVKEEEAKGEEVKEEEAKGEEVKEEDAKGEEVKEEEAKGEEKLLDEGEVGKEADEGKEEMKEEEEEEEVKEEEEEKEEAGEEDEGN